MYRDTAKPSSTRENPSVSVSPSVFRVQKTTRFFFYYT